jgi:hypothetical protein
MMFGYLEETLACSKEYHVNEEPKGVNLKNTITDLFTKMLSKQVP